MEPELFAHIVPIATSAELSPWGIAFNASQRMAIEADPSWNSDTAGAGASGLAAARSIALLSYRHYRGYGITQPRNRPVSHNNPNVSYAADSYQRYQGQKLVNRFDAQCYYRLTQAMDSHDISIGRGSSLAALKKITAKTLVIGIESDVLYPVEEQEFLAESIEGAQFMHLYSDFGHDGFLLEFDQIEVGMRKFWKDREEH
jgi:homoserine O-acetyltransferase